MLSIDFKKQTIYNPAIMSKDFIHLRCHTSFSLTEGAIKIEDLVKLVKQNKMPALAITDTGNLFASLEFSIACSESGIQPIIGCILQLEMQDDENLTNIVLLAKDVLGYKNLLKLCSKIFLEKYGTKPCHIKLEDLVKYHQGLICLSGGPTGPIGQSILQNSKTMSNS